MPEEQKFGFQPTFVSPPFQIEEKQPIPAASVVSYCGVRSACV